MNDVLDRARSLLSFSDDLERQLTNDDPAGVTGLVERFHQLQRELAAVDGARLEAANQDIGGVIETLTAVAAQLDQLLAVKRTLVGPSAQTEAIR